MIDKDFFNTRNHLISTILENSDLKKFSKKEVSLNSKLRYKCAASSVDSYASIRKLPGIGEVLHVYVGEDTYKFISNNGPIELKFVDLLEYKSLLEM